MLIIKTDPDGNFLNDLEIAKKHTKSNIGWITVVVGENGTKKSLLLRNMSQDILRPNGERKFVTLEGSVSKLIAVSGTPLDRFPRLNNRYPNRFAYFGLRASNNVAGTGQSEKSLVAALILNRNKLKKRELQLKSVFGQLGLKARVKTDFQMSRRYLIPYSVENNNNNMKNVIGVFSEHCNRNLEDGVNSAAIKDYKTGLRLVSTEKGREKLLQVLERVRNDFAHVTVSTAGNYVTKDTVPIAIWGILLESGIIELKKTWFQPEADSHGTWGKDEIPGSYLSSGQWSWLCTLGGLTVEIEDDSAVLIDEPENSLHPAWQRDYIPAIINIMKGLTGCHIIIATHSPLIASGLPPSAGNVIRLSRQIEDGASVISAAEAPNTFGWSSSDAYEALFELETTRAKIFNSNATKALRMIKDRSGSSMERAEVASALRLHCQSLSPVDSMRYAMESVLMSLEELSEETE